MASSWFTCDSDSEAPESSARSDPVQAGAPQHPTVSDAGLAPAPKKARTADTADVSSPVSWWVDPMNEAMNSARSARGKQCRPVDIGTACSGTDAPIHGLQAMR